MQLKIIVQIFRNLFTETTSVSKLCTGSASMD